MTLGIDEGLLGSLSRIDLTTGATTNLAEATVFAPHTIVPEAGGATALYLENSPLDGAILRITIPPASP